MIFSNLLFYIVSIFLVISAIMVIISSHSVFSLLFLVAGFILSSIILFLIECEFLALVFVIVYVGAIAVLFLFVVMMLDSKAQNLLSNSILYIPAGIFFIFLVLLPIVSVLSGFSSVDVISDFSNYPNWYWVMDKFSDDINTYGSVMYSYFVIQFLTVGLILLLVLVGVVYLTNEYTSTKIISQSVLKQISVNSRFFYP